MNNTASKILLAFVILEAVAIIWLVYDKFQQNDVKEQLVVQVKEVKDDKALVEQKLNGLLTQYDDLKTDNSAINKQLSEKKEEIKNLIKKLKYVKHSDRAKIKEMQDETEVLRSILKDYVKKIAKLDRKNKKLTAENKEIKNKFETEVEQKENLQTLKDSLDKKVQIASKLQVYNTTVSALNKRDRLTRRARKTRKYKVCITLAENSIIPKGTKKIYIRIADPDNQILRNETSGFFNYLGNGKKIAYSSILDVDYKGKAKQVCLYFSTSEKQKKGNYMVNIFADGYDVGEKHFTLK